MISSVADAEPPRSSRSRRAPPTTTTTTFVLRFASSNNRSDAFVVVVLVVVVRTLRASWLGPGGDASRPGGFSTPSSKTETAFGKLFARGGSTSCSS